MAANRDFADYCCELFVEPVACAWPNACSAAAVAGWPDVCYYCRPWRRRQTLVKADADTAGRSLRWNAVVLHLFRAEERQAGEHEHGVLQRTGGRHGIFTGLWRPGARLALGSALAAQRLEVATKLAPKRRWSLENRPAAEHFQGWLILRRYRSRQTRSLALSALAGQGHGASPAPAPTNGPTQLRHGAATPMPFAARPTRAASAKRASPSQAPS